MLLSAKLQTEGGDLKTAKAQLGWVVEHAGEVELREIARLRLANLLLDDKAYDEALKVLEREPAPNFAGRFHELRGDIHAVQGKNTKQRQPMKRRSRDSMRLRNQRLPGRLQRPAEIDLAIEARIARSRTMRPYLVAGMLALLIGASGGCSTIDKLNPFSSSAPKLPDLPAVKPTAQVTPGLGGAALRKVGIMF